MRESIRDGKWRKPRKTKTFTLLNYNVEVITNDRRGKMRRTYVSGLHPQLLVSGQQEIFFGLTWLNYQKIVLHRRPVATADRADAPSRLVVGTPPSCRFSSCVTEREDTRVRAIAKSYVGSTRRRSGNRERSSIFRCFLKKTDCSKNWNIRTDRKIRFHSIEINNYLNCFKK